MSLPVAAVDDIRQVDRPICEHPLREHEIRTPQCTPTEPSGIDAAEEQLSCGCRLRTEPKAKSTPFDVPVKLQLLVDGRVGVVGIGRPHWIPIDGLSVPRAEPDEAHIAGFIKYGRDVANCELNERQSTVVSPAWHSKAHYTQVS